jgi:hypothetical protein
MRATRLPFFFAAREAKSAVEDVPPCAPRARNTALEKGKTPSISIVKSIAVVAVED